MLIRMRRSWDTPERLVTDPASLDRRALLAGAGAAVLAPAFASPAFAQRAGDDPSAALYPVKRNPRYEAGKPTSIDIAARYNNFIELGPGKSTYAYADAFKVRPWRLTIDGLVDKPLEFEIDDLLRAFPLEERVCKLRCVETWAVIVPWSGFPLGDLVKRAAPKSDARYVRFEGFLDPKMAKGQRSRIYPWPYVEAITLPEAMNELAFMATGAYGAPLPKQMGAPLRLVVPWKYGFKSIKSVTRISFVAERPKSLWEKLQPDEYGFWANVNPEVPHKRWSQDEEELLGTRERTPTQLFNGYAEAVAPLYAGLKDEKLYY